MRDFHARPLPGGRAKAAPAVASAGRKAATRAWIAFAGLCLAALGAGMPGVMAGARSTPGWSVPWGWPAAKAAHMRSENRLRQAAASRPLLPPPVLAPRDVAPPFPKPPGRATPGLAAQGLAAPSRNHGATPQRGTGGGAMADPGAQSALMPGIVPLSAGGPFSPSQFRGTNLWNGPVGGRWEVIQAGGVPAGGRSGAASGTRAGLFVYTRSPDPGSAAGAEVTGIRTPSPDPAGLFTVQGARGDALTLSLPGSRALYRFDVVSLRFTR